MTPKTIQPYFEITQQAKDGGNHIIEGMLTCCNAHAFEVFAAGKIRHRLFSKMFLYPENDIIVLEARCKTCGKVIPVFHSDFDGYGQWQTAPGRICVATHPVNCVKCHGDSFSVTIKYEYPDVQELQELEIRNIDRAFTWIRIALACSRCGARYKNFVECETD